MIPNHIIAFYKFTTVLDSSFAVQIFIVLFVICSLGDNKKQRDKNQKNEMIVQDQVQVYTSHLEN